MKDDPFSDRCENQEGMRRNWTCCACYHDLGDVGSNSLACPECGAALLCTVEHRTITLLVTELGES